MAICKRLSCHRKIDGSYSHAPVILAGFRLSKRLGSYEREITGKAWEITYGTI